MNKSIVLAILLVSLHVHGEIKDINTDMAHLKSNTTQENSLPSGPLNAAGEKDVRLSIVTQEGVNSKIKNDELNDIRSKQIELEKNVLDLKSNNIDYAMWSSVLLGCVTIIITLISIIVALISFVGYRNFKKNIELRVQAISTEIAKEETTKQIDGVAKKELARLIDDGALTKHLESAVDMVYLRLRGRPDDSMEDFSKYPELDDEEHDK